MNWFIFIFFTVAVVLWAVLIGALALIHDQLTRIAKDLERSNQEYR